MGNIARAANDRTLACEGYRDARAASGELQRRHELLGYAERRLAGLDANLVFCARAAPAGRDGGNLIAGA